ncbi:MAG: flagellar basal body P-ring formation chaperone FlgA [Inquilinaceae bacterium]
MKQISVMLIAALGFVAAVAAEAAQGATLRSHAVVDGAEVTLGDLFDGLEPAMADVAIVQAPAAGRTVVLDARWLARVARAYKIDWTARSPYDRLELTRSSTRLSADTLADAVRVSLEGRVAGDRIRIELDDPRSELHLPTDIAATLAVEDLVYQPNGGRFSARLVAPAEGPARTQITVSGRALPVTDVPVLTANIRAGTVIGPRDIAWIEVAGDRNGPDLVTDPEDLIGMTPRRGIAPNTPIRMHDLSAPVVVARGDIVEMHLSSGALTVTAKGRALEDGARDDIIRVINVDSNRTVEARVTGDHAVTVAFASRVASAR